MKQLLLGTLTLLIAFLPVSFAGAAGTPAGTPITNQATATYNTGGPPITKQSPPVTTIVAEVLDVDVTWQDVSNVSVNPGNTAQVLTFRVTNNGNGNDEYTLTPVSSSPPLVGDDFDPVLTAAGNVFFDTNTNGVYDAGTDAEYIPGTNDPVLAADAWITVFVLNDIPGGVVQTDLGDSRLTATSNTLVTGSESPGDIIAGAGESGTDAVVGASGGRDNVIGTYEVFNVIVDVIKSASVLDQYGTAEPIPGAVITYTIEVDVTGIGNVDDVVITDLIPAETTYNTGTLTLNSSGLTDGADSPTDEGDVGDTTPGTVTVGLGTLSAASATQIITFKVTID